MRRIALFRAADDDYVGTGYSFAESVEVACAYLNNPGFGGSRIYRADVRVAGGAVVDLRGRSPWEVANAFELMPHEGIGVDEWLPRDGTALYAIRSHGYLWALVDESWPAGTTTWIWCGTGLDDEPELHQIDVSC